MKGEEVWERKKGGKEGRKVRKGKYLNLGIFKVFKCVREKRELRSQT